jgi:serine protease AprX
MRTGGHRKDVRGSALWGSGKRGTGSRGNALWGSGKRRTALLATLALMLTVPLGASAVPGTKSADAEAFVAPSLLSSASSRPTETFAVIVQGKAGNQAAHAVAGVMGLSLKKVRDLHSIDGVAVELTGAQVLALAADKHVVAITADARVRLSGGESSEKWPYVIGVQKFWPTNGTPAAAAATIAVVDSGIEAGGEVGSRTIGEISMTQLSPNASGDGHGHGTLVAGIAAAAAPGAHLIGIDVMDDQGKAMTSDVIAAADWVQQNKDRYRIRVANFSLHATRPSSFRSDPLDRAVERLWLGGVVVVTSAGNYRLGSGPSGVPFAPANDPFVINVGATDLGSVVGGADDFNAPWSAYGRTPDGFLKPDLGAPGRRLIGPVPVDSTIAAEHPDRIVNRGRMRMSGTSFAAPIVAGAAAHLLARHPNWTPDEVKGALMVSARHAGRAEDSSIGTGELDVRAALKITQPPNPNRALARFLVEDSSGSAVPVFDSASWDSAADTDASWDSASWADASWADASWADASWADASWADASWADASWADASWADASWVD